jgi:hypothetical protein
MTYTFEVVIAAERLRPGGAKWVAALSTLRASLDAGVAQSNAFVFAGSSELAGPASGQDA